VNDEGKERYNESMRDYLRARVSRAQLRKATGVGRAAAAIPGAVLPIALLAYSATFLTRRKDPK